MVDKDKKILEELELQRDTEVLRALFTKNETHKSKKKIKTSPIWESISLLLQDVPKVRDTFFGPQKIM